MSSMLSRLHVMQKRLEWGDLNEYLADIYPDIHAQFQQTDEEGFTKVGRHPFDIWRSRNNLRHGHVETSSPEILIRRAKVNVNGLSSSERRILMEHWVQDLQKDLKSGLFDLVEEAEATRLRLEKVHMELRKRVLQSADVIGLTTTGLAKNILTL
jgi:hypothetical protein